MLRASRIVHAPRTRVDEKQRINHSGTPKSRNGLRTKVAGPQALQMPFDELSLGRTRTTRDVRNPFFLQDPLHFEPNTKTFSVKQS